MARKTEEPDGIGRREFVVGAGVCVTGAVSTLAVGEPFFAKDGDDLVCRVLLHNPGSCAGCGVCSLMCSLYREREAGPVLARSAIVRDPFTYNFSFDACHQCRSPSCYFACPLKDTARLIDEATGLVYVDEHECIGCGSCIGACPFDPPGTKLHPVTRVALNCDRCLDRDEGPICVEYCTMNALTCSNVRPPRRIGGRQP